MKRSIALLLFPLFLLASCGREETGDGYTPISFRCHSLATGTRATSDIEQGRTIRIVVYRSEQGATSPVLDGSRQFVTSNTYEVLADGSLKPCLVDSRGNKIAGNAFDIQVPVYDGATRYLDFYAYSPALPLETDNKTVKLTNGIDFITTAKYGEGIVQSASGQVVDLDPMKHLCAAVRFKYIYNNDQVNLSIPVGFEFPGNRPLGLSIDNLYLTGAFTLGEADIVLPQDEVTGTYLAPEGTLANPSATEKTKLYGEIYLLPGAADNTQANGKITYKADVVFSIPAESLVNQSRVSSYPAADASAVLVKGVRTTYNMTVSYTGPSTKTMIIKSSSTEAITPWEEGGDNMENPIKL